VNGLPDAAAPEHRYAAERRKGREIAALGLERVWGWSSPAGRLRAARRAAFLVEGAGLGPGMRCLELGCGTGEFTARLVQSGCDLVAVDLSEASVEACRNRVGDRATVVVGNIETGDGLEKRSFDAIVGVSVLHHVDLTACLAATFPLLRSGGRFAFTEPNLANPEVWARRRIGVVRRWRHDLPHETAFRPGPLRGAFESAGLAVDVCEPFDFLHPSLPRALIRPVRRLEALVEATPLRELAGSVRIAGRRP
jgi:SAM-dependent methyltransferase